MNRIIFVALALAFSSYSVSTSHAALILTIDTYTSNELTFTISGTFDADTVGAGGGGWLAIKNDYTANFHSHTELFNNGPALPTITANTLKVGGVSVVGSTVSNGGTTYQDSFYVKNAAGQGVSWTAGTSVTGSVTLSGVGSFNPSVNNAIELASGFTSGANLDWARFEAAGTASSGSVPEPTTLAIWSLLGGIGLVVGHRRRRRRAA